MCDIIVKDKAPTVKDIIVIAKGKSKKFHAPPEPVFQLSTFGPVLTSQLKLIMPFCFMYSPVVGSSATVICSVERYIKN